MLGSSRRHDQCHATEVGSLPRPDLAMPTSPALFFSARNNAFLLPSSTRYSVIEDIYYASCSPLRLFHSV